MADDTYLVDGYLPTIGIECHVQLRTATKLFGVMSNDARGAEPNTLVDQVCFGLPGALPVLNEEAVRRAAQAAFALNTTPQPFSKFDRKHYFYPDLPKGYQISQFEEPIILGGSIDIVQEDGTTKTVNITRAHLEEDAGKSTHPAGGDYSLVDLNRAGTPLLEIVSEPEMHSAHEAKAFAHELWLRMKFADVSDVDLYQGNMRFDVNVSVSKNPEELGTRSETKNLNSFKSVEKAVNYEIARQIQLLEQGEAIVQETRGWVDDKQKTVSQRSKEDAHDYRYFPDPDIPPIVLSEEYIADVASSVPDMPDVWRGRLGALGVERATIETLLEARVDVDEQILDCIVAAGSDARVKTYANWIVNIEVPLRKERAQQSKAIDVTPERRTSVYDGVALLIEADKLSSNNAKSLIVELLSTDTLPADFEAHAQSKGYIQMSDSSAIESIVQEVLDANPQAVTDVQNGEQKAIGFLVGQVMKVSKGTANPALAKEIITKLIA